MDNELKTIRRELKLREDQLRQLERETQVRGTAKKSIFPYLTDFEWPLIWLLTFFRHYVSIKNPKVKQKYWCLR